MDCLGLKRTETLCGSTILTKKHRRHRPRCRTAEASSAFNRWVKGLDASERSWWRRHVKYGGHSIKLVFNVFKRAYSIRRMVEHGFGEPIAFQLTRLYAQSRVWNVYTQLCREDWSTHFTLAAVARRYRSIKTHFDHGNGWDFQGHFILPAIYHVQSTDSRCHISFNALPIPFRDYYGLSSITTLPDIFSGNKNMIDELNFLPCVVFG